MRRRLLPFLLPLLPLLAAEEDFALDEGYGEAVSAVAVLEPETGKPAFDFGKNRETKIPEGQAKRRKVAMVFAVTREGPEPRLEPVLRHQGAIEFWVLKGLAARTLRKALPQGPSYVKLVGDRVLEKWHAGGFSVKGEHGRTYSYHPDRVLWIKTRGEMDDVRARILVERGAAETARAGGRLSEAVEHLRALEVLGRDWPADACPGDAKTLLTLESLLRLEAGAPGFPDEKAHADFLVSVAQGIPASRFDFDRTARMRELLLERMREATPAMAPRMESQLLAWFRERYKDRSPDTACLDLAEYLSLVGARGSILPMDDYYKEKVLPGPWQEEAKARFAASIKAIRARAKAQTP